MLRVKINHFFAHWTPGMAYALGFFAADGYMVKGKRNNCFIGFDSKDKELIEKIKVILEGTQKISRRVRQGNKISYRIQVGSADMFGDLLKLGLTPNKSKTLCMPKIPLKYFRHFVRGYFDGDGCVSLGRYWLKNRQKWKWQFSTSFTSGSKNFLVSLLKDLQLVVHGGFICKKNRGYDLVFSVRDSVALFRFMYHNVLAKGYLKRKYLIFKKALNIMPMRA